ncbi:arylsulfatase B-like isoform X2 [Planococcus citri]|uniref:arylsulfatase B-like isoform X2 n=1 Tax=Planococcus citri TaxID=170843 RepID=UPI0031F81897
MNDSLQCHLKLLKMFSKLIIFCVFLLFECSWAAQKKNVVVIVADDLGWNDVSFHGSNQFLTPNIDILAYSGVILHNYYTLTVCSPSRSALMTGIHPIHTGMYHSVIHDGEPFGLPLNLKILPEYLKERGYQTRAVGKWHLGFYKAAYTPIHRGFDSHFGYWGSHLDYYRHDAAEFPVLQSIGYDFRRDMNTTWDYKGQYATDLFTQESVDIINSHNVSEPLFLYLAHLASHAGNPRHPLQAPAEIIKKLSYIEDKKRRTLAAMVWKLDESVGKVVQALASRNMLNDTIIIFTTDNGGPGAGQDGNYASNWPLRGMKATLWEGGVRGTAFVWSADLPHSRVSHALMHVQDWLPTILGAVDENITSDLVLPKGLDGRNMWPVLKGDKESEYNELIIQRDRVSGQSALRKDQWKLIKFGKKNNWNKWYGPSGRNKTYSSYNETAVKDSLAGTALSGSNFEIPTDERISELRVNVTISCKYCNNSTNGTNCTRCVVSKNGMCLFDVFQDPCEMNNLADKYPRILTNLNETMSKYIPVPPRNRLVDPRADPSLWNYTWVNWMDYVEKFTHEVKINVKLHA